MSKPKKILAYVIIQLVIGVPGYASSVSHEASNASKDLSACTDPSASFADRIAWKIFKGSTEFPSEIRCKENLKAFLVYSKSDARYLELSVEDRLFRKSTDEIGIHNNVSTGNLKNFTIPNVEFYTTLEAPPTENTLPTVYGYKTLRK